MLRAPKPRVCRKDELAAAVTPLSTVALPVKLRTGGTSMPRNVPPYPHSIHVSVTFSISDPTDPLLADKSNRRWCSAAMREDYIRLLAHSAHYALPPASDDMYLKPLTPEILAAITPSRTSTVWTFDATYKGTLEINIKLFPLQSKYIPAERDVVRERVRRIARLAEEDPHVALAQGLFRFNLNYVASTFAAVRYSPDSPNPHRYSVITSLVQIRESRAYLGDVIEKPS
ncbi:hypothetical protein NMY22_g17529 [Coprinellus aureogranulatus]|nr:hypothetical protein NMY22_g17529 [Coprinellus aureogranulatus]